MTTTIRHAEATWEGSVAKGAGGLTVGSGAIDVPFSLAAREGDSGDTNPEELVGAALAGCFTMSLANLLTRDGQPPSRLSTTATVHLVRGESGVSIPTIELQTQGDAAVDADRFAELAEQAAGCPVARLYAGAKITVDASLAAEH